MADKSLTIIGSFLSSDGLVSGSGTLALSDYVEGGSLDGNLDFSLQSPSPLPTVFGFPEIESGKLTIGLDLSGSAPALAELAALEWNSTEFLNQLDLTVKGKAEADGLSLASLVSNASLKARFKVVPNADGPAIDGRFKLSGEQFQLGDYSLVDVTVRGTTSGDFEALKFDITSETQLEGPLGNIGWINNATIGLGLFVDVTRDSAAVEIRNPSWILIEDLDLPAGPTLVTPQSFSLEELNVKADFANEPHYVFDGLLATVSLDTEINAGGMQRFLSAGSLDARFAGSFSGSEPLMMEGTIRSASVRLAQEAPSPSWRRG